MEETKSTVDAIVVAPVEPQQPSRLFRDLKEGEPSIKPLPPDNMYILKVVKNLKL